MNNYYKLLEIDDTYEICDYFKVLNPLVNKEVYKDAYILKGDFDDATVRNSCFTFNRLYCAKMHGNKIKDLCVLEVSQYPATVKSFTIKFISNLNEEISKLLEFSIKSAKELFEQQNYLILNIKKENLKNYQNIINILEANSFLELKNEFGLNKDLVIFSKNI